MKYMLLIYNDPELSDGLDPEKVGADYWTYTQEIVESGEMVAGDPVDGNETATSVRVRNGKRTTTDGPFAETKEVMGGYYIVDVKDLDRALELAAKIPGSQTGVIEVRPIRELG